MLVAVVVLGTAVATGCSSGPAAEPTWPLTGLTGYSADDAGQVITVKVDNTSAARPQEGLASADLVVQELVEGGVTRLAAMYQSKRPTVGPVRSLRETDIGLVLPTGGTVAASGGASSTIAALTAAGVPIAKEGDPGFSRSSDRSAPYNVMLDVAELAGTLEHRPPAGPYLAFGAIPEDAPSTPARTVTLSWPAARSIFTFDDATSTWRITDPETDAGDFTNVVALWLPVTYAGKDAAGTPIPTMQTEGSGKGVILSQGKRYDVTWSKSAPASPWAFHYTSDSAEHAFAVPAGRTWLALLPDEDGELSTS